MAGVYSTGERNQEDIFKTHYYKTSYSNLKKTFIEFVLTLGFQLYDWNDEFCEGCVLKGNNIINVKIITQSPIETSIDLSLSINSLLFSKRTAVKLLEKIYNALGEKYKFLGLGLHP